MTHVHPGGTTARLTASLAYSDISCASTAAITTDGRGCRRGAVLDAGKVVTTKASVGLSVFGARFDVRSPTREVRACPRIAIRSMGRW